MLKSYARDVLQLPKDLQNGLRTNIVFICTLVEENVGESVDLPKAWVLQILQVQLRDFDPTTIESLDVEKEFEKRACLYENPSQTSALMQDILTAYRGTQEGTEARDLATFSMGICEVQIAMGFKSDIKGATSSVESIETSPWSLMLASPEMPQPVLW